MSFKKELKMNAQAKIQKTWNDATMQFKQTIYSHRKPRFDFLIVLVFLIALMLSACGSVSALAGVIPIPEKNNEPESEPFLPQVFGPEAAREAALDFIRKNYGSSMPASDLTWIGRELSSDGMVGASVFQYESGPWSMQVSYPLVAPKETIYSIKLKREDVGFLWEGLVDATGQVATTTMSTVDPTVAPPQNNPTPSDVPAVDMLNYRDDKYHLAMQYPADWSLTEVSYGAGADAHAIRLKKESWTLVVHYKLLWDKNSLGGGLPAGEVVARGWATLLGRSVPKHFVVYGGKDKVLYYGDRFEDLEIYVRLDVDISGNADYDDVEIPGSIADQVEKIAASIVRTGPPISAPAPTPTQVVPTPTPIPVPCNAISFQADLTIPDGTIFAPDAEFIKTWRLKNIGSCVWNTGYDLVFVEGAQMGAAKAVALPEKIRPGERLDISVTLTSPSKTGDYRGYWMVRSDSGEYFGYGASANKAFWVEIEVVETADDYEYDFALNLCAATWRSEVLRLPCPGYSSSDEGFAQVLKSPKLENRNENEPAIWVHPNEERYGWIEGTYPTVKVQEGDHFKAWVGCLKDYDRCSLNFYLDYEDKNGKVHRLEEWAEAYDGQVTMIDLDLSALAGEKVRFILGVEALTKNVDDAQGFWFVPHIIQED
jgi:hypothetical protein